VSCLDANGPAASRMFKRRTKAFETVWDMELCGSDLRGLSLRLIECGVWGQWTAMTVLTKSVDWPEPDEDEEGDGA